MNPVRPKLTTSNSSFVGEPFLLKLRLSIDPLVFTLKEDKKNLDSTGRPGLDRVDRLYGRLDVRKLHSYIWSPAMLCEPYQPRYKVKSYWVSENYVPVSSHPHCFASCLFCYCSHFALVRKFLYTPFASSVFV